MCVCARVCACARAGTEWDFVYKVSDVWNLVGLCNVSDVIGTDVGWGN